MRLFIVALLLTGCALALDSQRTAVHYIGTDLSDHATYTDTLYGDWADGIRGAVVADAFSVLESRMPKDLAITAWSVRTDNSTITLSASGNFSGFIVSQGYKKYKISGKGFIDKICSGTPPATMPGIEQEFDFEIHVPPTLAITGAPESGEENLTHIYYKYDASYADGIARQRLVFILKEETDGETYCAERAGISQLLLQGFTAEERGRMQTSPFEAAFAAFITIMLCGTLYWLSR